MPSNSRRAFLATLGTAPSAASLVAQAGKPALPYRLSHRHGSRDAVPVPRWPVGRRITVAQIDAGSGRDMPPMYISAGKVVENVPVPPAGGCVVSVMVELDGVTDLLAYPGFHQIFFYGGHQRGLTNFCRLYGIPAQVV